MVAFLSVAVCFWGRLNSKLFGSVNTVWDILRITFANYITSKITSNILTGKIGLATPNMAVSEHRVP